MKMTIKRRKGGASVSISARSNADKTALTKLVMSGELIRRLNKIEGLDVQQVIAKTDAKVDR